MPVSHYFYNWLQTFPLPVRIKQHPAGQPKSLKVYRNLLIPDKALGTTILGHPEAQIDEAQLTLNSFHLTQGIKVISRGKQGTFSDPHF